MDGIDLRLSEQEPHTNAPQHLYTPQGTGLQDKRQRRKTKQDTRRHNEGKTKTKNKDKNKDKTRRKQRQEKDKTVLLSHSYRQLCLSRACCASELDVDRQVNYRGN
jgi:hypothetical protein